MNLFSLCEKERENKNTHHTHTFSGVINVIHLREDHQISNDFCCSFCFILFRFVFGFIFICHCTIIYVSHVWEMCALVHRKTNIKIANKSKKEKNERFVWTFNSINSICDKNKLLLLYRMAIKM